MNVAVITECALARKHGTGAQLLRILNDERLQFFHLYLTREYAGDSEVRRSFRIEDPRWKYRGRHKIGKLERLLGLNWWDGYQIDQARFRRLRDRHNLLCDAAYVCVANEDHAGKANALLDQLKVPYVVHIMDIYSDKGLDPATMPQLAKLFGGASDNIALSEAIRDEIAKFGRNDALLIPIGQDVTEYRATPPEPGREFKILTVGKPYETGTARLADAWPLLKQAIPNARIVYAGQHSHSLPKKLAAQVDNRGYIQDKEVYGKLLAECQVAYLSGPSELDQFGRFSIPSRTSDFLMAGLPVIAAVADGSATQKFLQPLVPESARFAGDPGAIVDAAVHFAGDQMRWADASEACRQFAIQNVAMEQVREKVVAALMRAAELRKKL